MTVQDKFILDGHTPVPATLMEWANWYQTGERRVAQDEINGVRVSTVFLGLNHAWDDGPPLLFETMIFGGEHDQHQERCSTWDEAELMHARAVGLVAESKRKAAPSTIICSDRVFRTYKDLEQIQDRNVLLKCSDYIPPPAETSEAESKGKAK